MSRRRKIVIAVVAVLLVLALGAVLKKATHDESVSGPGADRAREAAIEFIQGGEVKEVEFEREEAAAPWEVEVERPDGETVELLLDADYDVLIVEDD